MIETDAFKIVKSPQDWKQIEEILSPYRSIRFFVDDYRVVMKMVKYNMQLIIVLFVAGEYDVAKWERDSCEISEKFYQKKEYYLHSKKNRDFFVKLFGKKEAKKCGLLEKRSYTQYWWTSFRSLKNHLKKTCKEISVCKADLGQRLVDLFVRAYSV